MCHFLIQEHCILQNSCLTCFFFFFNETKEAKTHFHPAEDISHIWVLFREVSSLGLLPYFSWVSDSVKTLDSLDG